MTARAYSLVFAEVDPWVLEGCLHEPPKTLVSSRSCVLSIRTTARQPMNASSLFLAQGCPTRPSAKLSERACPTCPSAKLSDRPMGAAEVAKEEVTPVKKEVAREAVTPVKKEVAKPKVTPAKKEVAKPEVTPVIDVEKPSRPTVAQITTAVWSALDRDDKKTYSGAGLGLLADALLQAVARHQQSAPNEDPRESQREFPEQRSNAFKGQGLDACGRQTHVRQDIAS